jgi:5-methylcytosine-specific restriction enzyme A
MPYQSLRKCTQPGCSTLVKAGRCRAHSSNHYVERDPNVKRLYNSARWKQIRKCEMQLAVIPSLADYPLCSECLADGRLVEATELDHVNPHRGDVVKFFNGPFKPLCKVHHSSKTKRELDF